MSLKFAIQALGRVPEAPPPGLATVRALMLPAGSAGMSAVMVVELSTVTPVAGTPPTVTVAPGSNARPRICAPMTPLGGPATGSSESTKRGESSEVWPDGFVAAAVIGDPFATTTARTSLKVALPAPSVVTSIEPM